MQYQGGPSTHANEDERNLVVSAQLGVAPGCAAFGQYVHRVGELSFIFSHDVK